MLKVVVCPVSSRVERVAVNYRVVGSNPMQGFSLLYIFLILKEVAFSVTVISSGIKSKGKGSVGKSSVIKSEAYGESVRVVYICW